MELYYSLFNFIITFLIILVTIYIVRFYLSLKNYPPGPFPWPIFGNILMLKGTTVSPVESFMLMRKKYGDKLFTFWIGNWPCVFIFDYNLAKEAFNKGVFSGRPQSLTAKIFLEDDSDVIFTDFTPAWESLRKIAHNAAKIFSINDNLPNLTTDIVDEIIEMIIDKENGKAFDVKQYIESIMQNSLALIAFGQKYDIQDEEFKQINSIQDRIQEFGEKIAIADFIPLMRYPLSRTLKVFRKFRYETISLIRSKYNQHLETYQEGIIRDFADALIAAKNEAIKDAKVNEKNTTASYLNDDNLSLTLMDLFLAGSQTSSHILQWSILLMANHLDIQSKLREEVATQIGERIPTQDDRNLCPYVCAFINEVLRFRNAVPIGMFHSMVNDATIGVHKIAKGSIIFCVQYSILLDEQYWTNPNVFDPDRFLDSEGKLSSTKNPAFIPFGIGRRICPGEKLAMVDLFLIIIRILQKTEGYQFLLPDGQSHADLSPASNQIPAICSPKIYEIVLKKTVT